MLNILDKPRQALWGAVGLPEKFENPVLDFASKSLLDPLNLLLGGGALAGIIGKSGIHKLLAQLLKNVRFDRLSKEQMMKKYLTSTKVGSPLKSIERLIGKGRGGFYYPSPDIPKYLRVKSKSIIELQKGSQKTAAHELGHLGYQKLLRGKNLKKLEDALRVDYKVPSSTNYTWLTEPRAIEEKIATPLGKLLMGKGGESKTELSKLLRQILEQEVKSRGLE